MFKCLCQFARKSFSGHEIPRDSAQGSHFLFSQKKIFYFVLFFTNSYSYELNTGHPFNEFWIPDLCVSVFFLSFSFFLFSFFCPSLFFSFLFFCLSPFFTFLFLLDCAGSELRIKRAKLYIYCSAKMFFTRPIPKRWI